MITSIKHDTIDESLVEDAIRWRRELHQIPELRFDLYRTQKYLTDLLDSWDVTYDTGYGVTGLVVTLCGTGTGKTIAFRCDMDALPMNDDSGAAWSSQRKGCAHACGHDGHMAVMLAAIRHLSLHNEYSGCVKVLFQPCEETGQGAKAMMKDGLYDAHPYSELYGFHNMPRLQDRTVQLRYGAITGGGESFSLSVHGKSGHSSVPHQCINPISVVCEIVSGWDKITQVIEHEMAIIATCKIEGGTAVNGIPQQALSAGTMRYFEAHIADYMKEQMHSVAEKVCRKYGATYDLLFEVLCPATINTIEHSDAVIACARRIYGQDNVLTDVPASPGGEDMQFFVNDKVEGVCWFMVGTKGTNLHTATFDFDDTSLRDTASLIVNIVRQRLGG
ncbi:M20 metallopeptidase family protein [Vibrio quintilis]|uniref:M20 metallopeptidase family protein n=2 Tax=Vibrio quintilis TaxID=1117707 RepID=UPI0021C810D2|nr:M20 family metallopeptidase [Vibrio quintilis]